MFQFKHYNFQFRSDFVSSRSKFIWSKLLRHIIIMWTLYSTKNLKPNNPVTNWQVQFKTFANKKKYNYANIWIQSHVTENDVTHQNIRHTNYSKGCFHKCCPSNTVFDDIAVTWDYLTSTSTTSLKLSKLSSYQTTLCKISTVSKNTKSASFVNVCSK